MKKKKKKWSLEMTKYPTCPYCGAKDTSISFDAIVKFDESAGCYFDIESVLDTAFCEECEEEIKHVEWKERDDPLKEYSELSQEIGSHDAYNPLIKRHAEHGEDWVEDCIFYWGKLLTGEYKHWCLDWDDLPIDETCQEIESCCCYDKPIKLKTKKEED